MITIEKKIFINLRINKKLTMKIIKCRVFVYINAPDNTKYKLDSHRKNSRKTICADKWQSMCTSMVKCLHILYWRT